MPCGIKAGSNVGSTSENAPDYEDASDYLDPSNDADYQLISQLREGLGNGFTNAKNSGDCLQLCSLFIDVNYEDHVQHEKSLHKKKNAC